MQSSAIKNLTAIAGTVILLSTALTACMPDQTTVPADTTPQHKAGITTSTASGTRPTTSAYTLPASVTAKTTEASTPTTSEPDNVYKPAPGFEFNVPLQYDKWTVADFDYDIVHEPGSDYHFPWSLAIKNDTETDLELTAYIIHWGFHGWVGFVTETPFTLKAGETRTITGEDVFEEVEYEQMLYLESTDLEVYIAEG